MSLCFAKPSCLHGIGILVRVEPHPLSSQRLGISQEDPVVKNENTKNEDIKVKMSKLQGSSDGGGAREESGVVFCIPQISRRQWLQIWPF